MLQNRLFSFGTAFICFILLSLNCVYAEDFTADNTQNLMDALSKANSMPNESHKIDITNDVSLSSAVTEAVSIELNGSNIDDHNVLSLDGYIFTFNGAGKSSKIADLDIQSDKQGSGIVVNNQTFTIDSSNFYGNSFNDNNAIITSNSGSLYIINSSFKNNTGWSGGAIANKGTGSLNMEKSTVSQNKAYEGGGLYIVSGTTEISDTNITENNSTYRGGGIYFANGTGSIKNSILSNNTASIQGGASYINGGAISNSGSLIVSNSTFTCNNAVSGHGGAIEGGNSIQLYNTTFDKNTANYFGGAVSLMYADSVISDCVFSNNESQNERGGAMIIYGLNAEFKNSNIFNNNTAKTNGGAIYIGSDTTVNMSGTAQFINNTAKEGLGGALYIQGIMDINADNPEDSIIFSGNTDSSGSNAFHLHIDPNDPSYIGTMNLNISNGSKIVLADNISGLEGTKLNINGTSSYNDNIFLGSANNDFKGDITTKNINLNFYDKLSGLPNAPITSVNTNFNFMNGFVNDSTLNLNLKGGGNSLCIDVDPANLIADYINMTGSPDDMTMITIRDINVISDPVQSVTIFDIFDQDKFGTDLALSQELQNSIVYGGLKTYKWALTPKLTLIELGGLNPNIQRYQGATAAAFMNQMLSYDYSLNRTDEIYTNLREQKLASRKLNSYASNGPTGLYVDNYYEDGSAMWIRPYVNLETFNLSGASGGLNNQSYGFMIGFDFPIHETRNDWTLFPTIYASYLGSSQQYLDSHMNQNGGYGGFSEC